jgi:hypothetical protein
MNSIGKIACATIVAASLFLMSACTIARYQSLGSEAFLTPENNMLTANASRQLQAPSVVRQLRGLADLLLVPGMIRAVLST